MEEPIRNIIHRFLLNECSEEDVSRLATWAGSSASNAEYLFRLEELFYLGQADRFADPDRIEAAKEKLLKRLSQEE